MKQKWRPFKRIKENVKWFAIRLYLKNWISKCWKAIQERFRNGG
jgi:hypothetical protein